MSGVALLGAGGLYDGSGVVVAECGGQNEPAGGAGLRLGAGGLGTLGVTRGINEAIAVGVTAIFAGMLGVAVVLAGGRSDGVLVGVTRVECQHRTAYGTELILGTGSLRALGVTRGIGELAVVGRETVVTGVSGVALLGAGGLYDGSGVIVTECGGQNEPAGGTDGVAGTGGLTVGRVTRGIHGLLVGISAMGAGIGADTAVLTGGRDGQGGDVIVTEAGGQDLTAHGTGLILGTGGLGTLGVTRGIGGGVGVLVTAGRAGMGGIASLGAGGRGDGVRIAVAELRLQDLTADDAELILGAGGGVARGVTQGGAGGIHVLVAADRAEVVGVALLGAGGMLHGVLVAVAIGGGHDVTAEETGLMLGAGSLGTLDVTRRLRGGIHVLVAAEGADVLCEALQHAGGRLYEKFVAVTRHGRQQKTASGAGLILGAGGMLQVREMGLQEAVGLSADVADRRLGAGGLTARMGGKHARRKGLLPRLTADAGEVVEVGLGAGGLTDQVGGVDDLTVIDVAGVEGESVLQHLVVSTLGHGIPCLGVPLEQDQRGVRSYEHAVSQCGQSGGEGSAGEGGAIAEGVIAHGGHTLGERDLCKALTAKEGGGTDLGHAAGDIYALQGGAVVEGEGTQRLQALGEADVDEITAVQEGVRAQGGDALLHRDGGDDVTLGEPGRGLHGGVVGGGALTRDAHLARVDVQLPVGRVAAGALQDGILGGNRCGSQDGQEQNEAEADSPKTDSIHKSTSQKSVGFPLFMRVKSSILHYTIYFVKKQEASTDFSAILYVCLRLLAMDRAEADPTKKRPSARAGAKER